MGALKGSISYTLYHVDGELPQNFTEQFLERIQEFSFRELKPESEDDTSHGWCVLGDMLDIEFDASKVFRNEYLGLGLRVDKWALPGALLKALIERKGKEVMEQKGKTRLLRSEKEAIRETVTRGMKEMMLPSAAMVDMVWNLEEKQVRFWTQSGGRCELFMELFESTFGVRLVPTNPYVAAINCGLSDAEVGALSDVEQVRFTSFE